MPSRKFLFFDLGWTLEDETAAQRERATRAMALLRERDIAVTPDMILERMEEGARAFEASAYVHALASFGLETEQAREVAARSGWDKSKLRLYPEAIPTLDALAEDHHLGLIANQSPGTRARLEEHGILGYFKSILASDELGLSKPNPRIFQLALEQSGCRAEDAWMIGDRLDNDIRPANEAGWTTVRLLQGYNACQQPREALDQPDHTLENLSQLIPIVHSASMP